MKNLKTRKSEGITLIALVITIIVLLILVGVSLSLVLGEEGLIGRTISAREVNENAEEKELVELAVSTAQIDGEGTITTDKLNNALNETFHNDTEASENEEGWDYQGNKKYKIYQDGKVEDVGNSESILPKEYQQVEYIEANSNQYIDTGLKFNDKYQLEIKYKFSTFPNNQTWLTGAWNNSTGILIGYCGGRFYCYAGNETKSGIQYSVVADKDIHYVKIKKEGTFFDNNKVAITNFDEIPNTDETIKVFKRLITFEDYNSIRRIYELNYYNIDDVLVRNYIPCYSITAVINANGTQVSTNTKGLYDLVEGKFYTNKNTSCEDFTAGLDV